MTISSKRMRVSSVAKTSLDRSDKRRILEKRDSATQDAFLPPMPTKDPFALLGTSFTTWWQRDASAVNGPFASFKGERRRHRRNDRRSGGAVHSIEWT
jgi:hypothetical protein